MAAAAAIPAARRLALLLGAVVCGHAAASWAAPPAPCDLRFAVHFTPDVENPRDPAFLGALLGANPGYVLRVHRRVDPADNSSYELELTGPGPTYVCRNIVDAIGRSGFVLSVVPIAETAPPPNS